MRKIILKMRESGAATSQNDKRENRETICTSLKITKNCPLKERAKTKNTVDSANWLGNAAHSICILAVQPELLPSAVLNSGSADGYAAGHATGAAGHLTDGPPQPFLDD
jgi:hypothetical protein